MFTVLTATYNRRHTLPRAYASLCAQTFRDFEWVIVDDGSADGTADQVRSWQLDAAFPIRYFYQPNAGKHVAFNHGVREAAGDLLLSFDSDDSCVPHALERFKVHWDTIPKAENFSTLSALCVDEEHDVIGGEYAADVVDTPSFLQQYRLRSAERWGVNRTDVLREFPFPEISGERFIPEAVVWNRISRKYSARFVNEKLRIYHANPDGLCASLVRIRAENPRGARLYYSELAQASLPAAEKLKALLNYIRFSFHAGIHPSRVISECNAAAVVAMLLPLGYAAYRRDCVQLRRSPAPAETRAQYA